MTMLRHDADHDRVCASQARHVLVVAPPGTGKTCLSVRLAGAIANGLERSERVLLITFSNQARVRLEEEAAKQLAPATRQRVEVTNYHGFFWRVVRCYRRALGLPAQVEIGSRRQRLLALEAADRQAVDQLRGREGLLDGFAEQAFECFRDDRTPDSGTRERLLVAVEAEHRAGRLVFDDLGALTWRLLESFPAVDTAYRARYPVVIADEHQDASELQDAIVRRFARHRLVVLADPMQLIYGFRGSRPERLERHENECDERFELCTPHRWHHDPGSGRWLQAVRTRLQGRKDTDRVPAPASLRVIQTKSDRGFNAMKPEVKFAVSRAFGGGADTVAVLAGTNDDVASLRAYLSKQGLYPRQLGGEDFEEARADIEQVPRYVDRMAVALHAVARLKKLVPTLAGSLLAQIERRVRADGVNLRGNCSDEASGLLRALAPVYEYGAEQYVLCLVAMLDECRRQGHHLPRGEAVRALRATADAFESSALDLGVVMRAYADHVATASQAAPRLDRGLFVMTAHQAKGKEFDAVVLVNASERHFPDNEERRRLFYVAITRASRKWVIIVPDARATLLMRHVRA